MLTREGMILLSPLISADEDSERGVKNLAFHATSRISADGRQLSAYTKPNNRTNIQVSCSRRALPALTQHIERRGRHTV